MASPGSGATSPSSTTSTTPVVSSNREVGYPIFWPLFTPPLHSQLSPPYPCLWPPGGDFQSQLEPQTSSSPLGSPVNLSSPVFPVFPMEALDEGYSQMGLWDEALWYKPYTDDDSMLGGGRGMTQEASDVADDEIGLETSSSVQSPHLSSLGIGGLPELQHQWGGSAKAARSKRRIARQMIGGCLTPRNGSSSPSPPCLSSYSTTSPSTSLPDSSSNRRRRRRQGCTANMSSLSQSTLVMPLLTINRVGMRLVLHKQLKNSDVSSLGRIVLPKREAEARLPYLAVKEGIQLAVKELFSPSHWRMRYRYWPNNKSKMYVLENTGDFVKKNELRCGDFIALYQDESNQLYIYGLKVDQPVSSASLDEHPNHQEADENNNQTTVLTGNRSEQEEQDGGRTSMEKSPDYKHSMRGDESSTSHATASLMCFDGYDFLQLERLPSINECDLSIYDIKPDQDI